MKLEIVSPDGILFEGETESVSFPGVAGSFDTLPHHAPLLAALKACTIRFEANGKRQEQTIQSGFVEVKDDILSVCSCLLPFASNRIVPAFNAAINGA